MQQAVQTSRRKLRQNNNPRVVPREVDWKNLEGQKRREMATMRNQSTYLVTVFNRKVDISTENGRRWHTILRHCEILKDSMDIINTSCNLSTVLSRINVASKEFETILLSSDSDLLKCRLKTRDEVRYQYNKFIDDQPLIINNAIKRAATKMLEHAKTLKTSQGQINCINKFVDESLSLNGLFPMNISALNSIRPISKNTTHKI